MIKPIVKLLATAATAGTIKDFFGGGITPPGPAGNFTDPATALSKMVTFGIRMFVFLASFALLAYLMWGALDWIMSGGEKERLTKAQSKITNAIIGFFIVFIVLSLFGLITGDILGIVTKSPTGDWIFVLPTLK